MSRLFKRLVRWLSGNRKQPVSPLSGWRCMADIPPVPSKLACDLATLMTYPDAGQVVSLRYGLLEDPKAKVIVTKLIWRN
jgi:hypothetical protein